MRKHTASLPWEPESFNRWASCFGTVLLAHCLLVAAALETWITPEPTAGFVTGQALLVDMLPAPSASAPPSHAVEEPHQQEQKLQPVQEADVTLPKPAPRTETRRRKTNSKPAALRTTEENPVQRDQSQDTPGQQAPSSNTSVTTQSDSSAAAKMSLWHGQILSHLERHKHYPRLAKARYQEGTVVIRFRIARTGDVLSVGLEESSGFPLLDQEGLDLVRRASPLPPPPSGTESSVLELVSPIQFYLR
ncbi:energy transducer TonB [Haematospirillum sp. 15-248]|uniref:energy transducer TonB family protein n=1 Tax=Haematospirillum sp. 15-248 TaxID=2723107 RepID=UPI001439C6AC|nr:energy transducer TonB [Haematospirillum sp. 15-248]NKD86812.1 energy transducer TonB [Haematospirillum sp. 15-248]